MYDGCETLAAIGREPAFRLNIMYYPGSQHYNPILSLKGATGSRGGYCIACNISYRKDIGHRCSEKCPRCYAVSPCKASDEGLIKCDRCNRVFFENSCFERHRAKKLYDEKSLVSVCESIQICSGCRVFITTKSRHECGVVYCVVRGNL